MISMGERIDMSTTSITATGRRLTCAALTLGLIGVGVTSARAHETEVTRTKNVNSDWTGSDFSPCTGEQINIQGKETTTSTERQTPGKTYFKFTSVQSGTGTGTQFQPANQYKYSNRTVNEMRSSACRFTSRFENMKKIIRTNCPERRNDDYFLHHMESHKVDNCTLTRVDREKTKSRCK
jgi:hypothetical protein